MKRISQKDTITVSWKILCKKVCRYRIGRYCNVGTGDKVASIKNCLFIMKDKADKQEER